MKVSVNLHITALEAVKALAKKRGATITHVLHCAIQTEKYIDQAQRDGEKILIETKDGQVRQLIFQ